MGNSKRLAVLAILVAGAVACDVDGAGDDYVFGDDTTSGIGVGDTGSDDIDGPGRDAGQPDPTGPQPTCGDETVFVQAAPVDVVLVLDKSRSMISNTWDHDDDANTSPVTRWSSLHDVVADLASDLDEQMQVGAVLFPAVDVSNTSDPAEACRVADTPDVAVAPDNAAALLSALPPASSTDLFGGTPATAGVAVALDHLVQRDAGGAQAIVLVTDGAANCRAGVSPSEAFAQYDTDLAPLVSAAYDDHGIATYVVGIDIVDGWVSAPSTNPYEALSEVAWAGGAARPGDEPFYNAADPAQLGEALDEVRDRVACTVVLDDVVAEPGRTRVRVDGQTYQERAECDGDGWRFVGDGPEGSTIELCEAACGVFLDVGQLEVELACLPEP